MKREGSFKQRQTDTGDLPKQIKNKNGSFLSFPSLFLPISPTHYLAHNDDGRHRHKSHQTQLPALNEHEDESPHSLDQGTQEEIHVQGHLIAHFGAVRAQAGRQVSCFCRVVKADFLPEQALKEHVANAPVHTGAHYRKNPPAQARAHATYGSA
jgi:hypothetical protein